MLLHAHGLTHGYSQLSYQQRVSECATLVEIGPVALTLFFVTYDYRSLLVDWVLVRVYLVPQLMFELLFLFLLPQH